MLNRQWTDTSLLLLFNRLNGWQIECRSQGISFAQSKLRSSSFFSHLIKRMAIPIMAITIMVLEKFLPAWSFSLEWWSWLRNRSLFHVFLLHIWVNWLFSLFSWRWGVDYGLWMDLHWSKHGWGGGGAEQPERADYGNASTDRLKGCALEAQDRSNKSSILPLLAVKCLGFLSITKTGGACTEYQTAADKHIKSHALHRLNYEESLISCYINTFLTITG